MSNLSSSSRERVLRAIRFEPTDCAAVAPYMYDVAAQHAGIALRTYYTRGDVMARAQLGLHADLQQDVIAVGSDNYYIAEGFGCDVVYHDNQLPTLQRPALKDLNEVFELEVPTPETDGRMPVMLEAIRTVKQAVGDEIAIRSPGTGPFALASYLIGSEQWLYEIAMVEAGMPEAKEAAIRHALGLATDALVRFGKSCLAAGADILHCGDSLASCNVIAPATYQRFVLPYQQEVFAAWKQAGAPASLLHICGNSTPVLSQYAETGADVIEIDNDVDLSEARRLIAGRAAVMGNMHTVNELWRASRDVARQAANRCLRSGGKRGFVLGSGCIVPRHTPLVNLREMVRAARGHGM
jgi:uroporphyrinogen decarboxylase